MMIDLSNTLKEICGPGELIVLTFKAFERTPVKFEEHTCCVYRLHKLVAETPRSTEG